MDIKIIQARDLARRLHASQVRRESGNLFFEAHLIPVAALVTQHGGDALAVAAALCHDILEDVGEEHARDIAAISPELLAIVEQVTERGATWEEEKQGYVDGVSRMDWRALLVSICDKTGNAHDFVSEWKQGKFGKRPRQILWFFYTLQRAYANRAQDLDLDYHMLLWDLSGLQGEMLASYESAYGPYEE